MKKIIIGLTGTLLVAFVFVLIGTAQNSAPELKRASKEVSKDPVKSLPSSYDQKIKEGITDTVKKCDPVKCKESGCDKTKCNEGKCDTLKFETSCAGTQCEESNCCSAADEAACCETQCESANCETTGEKCCTNK